MTASPPTLEERLDTETAPEAARRAEFDRRRAEWLADNPGAWGMGIADFEARLHLELGL